MLEFFFILASVVACYVSYNIGYKKKTVETVEDILTVLDPLIPVNVELTFEQGIWYARIMIIDQFLGQSDVKEDLLSMVCDIFPSKRIVFSENSNEAI